MDDMAELANRIQLRSQLMNGGMVMLRSKVDTLAIITADQDADILKLIEQSSFLLHFR